MKPVIVFLVTLMSLGFLSTASAMRCGTKLVNKGDHQTRVLKYCGEPTSVLQRAIVRTGPTRRQPSHRASSHSSSTQTTDSEVLRYNRSYVEIIIEEWTYNLGPNKLMRVVIFENGIVTDVRRLGYGYPD